MGYIIEDKKLNILPVDGKEKKCVPVLLTPYKGGVPGMAILLQSILDNSTEGYFYDIIAIHNREVTEQEQERILDVFKEKANFSIRFFDIHNYIMQNDFFCKQMKKRNSYIATFYRLLIPELLPEYEKVIYLDIDTIVVTDIGKLIEYDISKVMIAGVRDIVGNRDYYLKNRIVKEYRDNILRLKYPDNYFNAGVLMINIKAFLQKFSRTEWWQFVDSYKWKSHDQDILNALCNQSVLLLPYSWNFIKVNGRGIEKELSEEDWNMILEAEKEPFIIHYAGRYKPWNYCTIPFFDDFWNYAQRSPFFEDVFKMIGDDQLINRIIEKAENGAISIKTIKLLFFKWLTYGWNCLISRYKNE